VLLFAGCSGNKEGRIAKDFGDTVLIIGYTEEAAPFIEVADDGTPSGFIPELWDKIFDSVKGDLKSYRFEKVEKGYMLEDDGGFFDKDGKEYSAGLLMGAVHKNDSTFNEDYSFSDAIITDRIIAVTAKDSKIKTYADFKGAKVAVTGKEERAAFEKHSAISSVCAGIEDAKSIDEALSALDEGKADVVITDEFKLSPLEKASQYNVLGGELDALEYVIACAKYSGWKDSINTAIYELKSPNYDDRDDFTPLVEKYFGYNASRFSYEPKQTK
jgi:ABC-type amino acid transport substrate-binding protein